MQKYVGILKKKNEITAVLDSSKLRDEYKKLVLEVDELLDAKILIIRMFQEKYFMEDIQSLTDTKELTKHNRLQPLCPFFLSNISQIKRIAANQTS